MHYTWSGLNPDESTDAIEGKYVGTINVHPGTGDDGDSLGSEVAAIVHRDSADFPIDGPVGLAKYNTGMALTSLLNEAITWDADTITRYPVEALDSLRLIVEYAHSVGELSL